MDGMVVLGKGQSNVNKKSGPQEVLSYHFVCILLPYIFAVGFQIVFKRLHAAFDDISTRKQTFKLLLHIVSKKPPWLHKIVKEQILNDIFK